MRDSLLSLRDFDLRHVNYVVLRNVEILKIRLNMLCMMGRLRAFGDKGQSATV